MTERNDGAARIMAERDAHLTREGYTVEHDDGHTHGELAKAADAYLIHNVLPRVARVVWPWGPETFKAKDRVRDLVRAGALIAAEVDRLLRKDGEEAASV